VCNDDPATSGSFSYKCSCGVAYVGTNTLACTDKNECTATTNCQNDGDTDATCIDAMAPMTGWDCDCGSALWTKKQLTPTTATCVDTDECTAAKNPCGNGTCTNVLDGGGYTCGCNNGFVSTTGKTPTCVPVTQCGTAQTNADCVISAAGNSCVNNSAGAGHTCICKNPAYAVSADGSKCVNNDGCASEPCLNDGDNNADCTDHPPPETGYDCTCSPGFLFDGATCADINECVGGANPCGNGTCDNTRGGWQCVCPVGWISTGGNNPSCQTNSPSVDKLQITAKAGSWCAYGGRGQLGWVGMLLLATLMMLRRRRA
jgi:fibrillin 1